MADITRNQFFKILGSGFATLGLSKILNLFDPEKAYAQDAPIKRIGKITIQWLGHGTFRFISTKGTVILLDPWLETNPKCPAPYRRAEGFDKIDIILYTHGHMDHFMLPDLEGLAKKFNPKIVAPNEMYFLIKENLPVADLQRFTLANKGASSVIEGINISMVSADHSSNAQLTGFESAPNEVGEAVGYIMEFENGFKIYHSGDTGLMSDMKFIIGDFYKPDLAILPIGNAYTMGPKEAGYACKLIGANYAIPEHYASLPSLVQTADDFIKFTKIYSPKTEIIILKHGEEIYI